MKPFIFKVPKHILNFLLFLHETFCPHRTSTISSITLCFSYKNILLTIPGCTGFSTCIAHVKKVYISNYKKGDYYCATNKLFYISSCCLAEMRLRGDWRGQNSKNKFYQTNCARKVVINWWRDWYIPF